MRHPSSALVTWAIESSSRRAQHEFSLQRLQILPALPCKPPCFSLLRQRARAGRKPLRKNTYQQRGRPMLPAFWQNLPAKQGEDRFRAETAPTQCRLSGACPAPRISATFRRATDAQARCFLPGILLLLTMLASFVQRGSGPRTSASGPRQIKRSTSRRSCKLSAHQLRRAEGRRDPNRGSRVALSQPRRAKQTPYQPHVTPRVETSPAQSSQPRAPDCHWPQAGDRIAAT